ncbi:efflux RND transporter periplasmic adaptor subunit [Massilia forsythiae]|uniref:efflux RND transporter periplasmic adaptor subunit n=1 Tax=Massilia forsythiae TaxID=2728020 RepID=UPI001E2AFE49|nr:efflux RND transporter periplasmic adaptor subunit [Massilia forsythiae]
MSVFRFIPPCLPQRAGGARSLALRLRAPGASRVLSAFVLPVLFSSLLAACSKPAPPVADVRPVRAATLAAANGDVSAVFSGDVRPRYESGLGFRVGGKISARKVDVGTVVKRGQLLMQLDPQDLRLGQAQAQANLRAAQTTLDLARAELKRYQDLRAQNFVSQAVLDQKAAALRSGEASVEAARAALGEQANQARYANLEADADGVVTAIDAEVGQVVQAGAPVLRVARTDEKEVVIGVPEDQVSHIRKVDDVKVRLWADPGRSIRGSIREVAPMADAATRTYAVKVSVPARDDVRMGMTAAVELVRRGGAGAAGQVRAPLSALYQDKGATSVWVIENDAVKLTPVRVGGVVDNDVLLAQGVRPGQVVVTAGVNLLKEGQKVRILRADVARRGDAEAEANGGAGTGDGAKGAGAAAPAAPPSAAAGTPSAAPQAAPGASGSTATGGSTASGSSGAGATASGSGTPAAAAPAIAAPALGVAGVAAGGLVASSLAPAKPAAAPASNAAAKPASKPIDRRAAGKSGKTSPKKADKNHQKKADKRSGGKNGKNVHPSAKAAARHPVHAAKAAGAAR